jgi:3-oxoacyl-[acyl-carrier protein] reductase
MSLPLANKVAIVTGSSRSIGAALAIRLAHDGASVVINYVSNSHAAQEVVSTIEKEGNGKAVAIATDICTAQGRQSLVDQTVQKWGKIDILFVLITSFPFGLRLIISCRSINNAGVMKLKTLDVLDEANFDEHFLLNVKAPLFMTKAVLPVCSSPFDL